MANYVNVKENNFLFTTFVSSKRTEKSAYLLIESIRAFSGAFSDKPIWCLVPKDEFIFSNKIYDRLIDLEVKIIPFKIESTVKNFPFGDLVEAGAHAESLALNEIDCLAWLNPNSLVLHEPFEFLVSKSVKFGYRPVHHTLIGSLFDVPLDEFWSLIYDYCKVPGEAVFPMNTHVDNKVIRPYFNAGCHATRPETGLLKLWKDKFLEIYQEESMRPFYDQDNRYRVFTHQAVLTGIVLSSLEKEEISEFSPSYNYPIHLYYEDMNEDRPINLDAMVTIRHEGFFNDHSWKENIPLGDSIKNWLSTKLTYLNP